MITQLLDVLAGILLIIGGFFAFVAALGVLRLPDLYTRMHAASKAGTLGSGVMLLEIAIATPDLAVAIRAIAGILFFLLTAPISAHLLASAAYCVGHAPWAGTRIDDLRGRYSGEGESIACAGEDSATRSANE